MDERLKGGGAPDAIAEAWPPADRSDGKRVEEGTLALFPILATDSRQQKSERQTAIVHSPASFAMAQGNAAAVHRLLRNLALLPKRD